MKDSYIIFREKKKKEKKLPTLRALLLLPQVGPSSNTKLETMSRFKIQAFMIPIP